MFSFISLIIHLFMHSSIYIIWKCISIYIYIWCTHTYTLLLMPYRVQRPTSPRLSCKICFPPSRCNSEKVLARDATYVSIIGLHLSWHWWHTNIKSKHAPTGNFECWFVSLCTDKTYMNIQTQNTQTYRIHM